ncbi:hypothetical protein GCM10009663_62970 [Kitasatospora arboriphila]|uniref:Uncharacterized protein n=1 Tax=Kitasatospora arboriphila TaxID=258052 RepID=A0ABP4ENS9_9ACTN
MAATNAVEPARAAAAGAARGRIARADRPRSRSAVVRWTGSVETGRPPRRGLGREAVQGDPGLDRGRFPGGRPERRPALAEHLPVTVTGATRMPTPGTRMARTGAPPPSGRATVGSMTADHRGAGCRLPDAARVGCVHGAGPDIQNWWAEWRPSATYDE